MKDVRVYGRTVDDETRCAHWASALDVIAIRFACCNRYYPCHSCHQEAEEHEAQTWPTDAFTTKAVLCGVCRTELTIATYLASDRCPSCDAAFNPACSLHHGLYFALT